MTDKVIRDLQRAEFLELRVPQLKGKDDGKEIPYSTEGAEEMRGFLVASRPHWTADLTEDFERLLRTWERAAEEYKKRQARKAAEEARKQAELEEWEVIDHPWLE